MALAQTHPDDALVSLDGDGMLRAFADARDALPDHPATDGQTVFAFHDTLRDAGVDTIDVPASSLSDPETLLREIYMGGRDELRERGLPDPDPELYAAAAQTAQVEGRDFHDVLAEAKAERPLAVREDLPLEEAFTPIPEPCPVMTPLPEWTRQDELRTHGIGTPEDIGVGNFKEYDFHLGATIPFKGTVEGLRHVQDMWMPGDHSAEVANPAHGYFMVTNKGVVPERTLESFEEDVLAIGRAGPDDRGALMLPAWAEGNEQSPTEKGKDGDLYVANRTESLEDDFLEETSFSVETRSVVLDLELYRGGLEARRQGVNITDIDYRTPGPNSNTYYNHEVEFATGRPAPDRANNGERDYSFPGREDDLSESGYDGYDLDHHPDEPRYTPIPEDDYCAGL